MLLQKDRLIINELKDNFSFYISKLESSNQSNDKSYSLIDDYIGMFYDTEHSLNNGEDHLLISFSIYYATTIKNLEKDKMLDSMKVIVASFDEMLADPYNNPPE